MGGVIVHDNVDVEAIRNLRVDLFKKIQKLGGSVALVTFANHESRRLRAWAMQIASAADCDLALARRLG